MLGDCRFISDFVVVAALIVIMVPPADMYIYVIYFYISVHIIYVSRHIIYMYDLCYCSTYSQHVAAHAACLQRCERRMFAIPLPSKAALGHLLEIVGLQPFSIVGSRLERNPGSTADSSPMQARNHVLRNYERPVEAIDLGMSFDLSSF